ncbi:MAG: glutamine amidotransferase [Firmicutes bacterium]|nr:glutamine amidotransferase [Bacillota bacterium]
MNMYGDRGNVIALSQRARWRGLDVNVHPIGLGDAVDPDEMDLLFGGGGQDKEQQLIGEDFERLKGPALAKAVEAGLPILAVCGTYQLLGQYYLTAEGRKIPGLGVLNAWTEAGTRRMIGNVVIEAGLFGSAQTLVGFENHSGRTYLSGGVAPLGRVVRGNGNNGEDGMEGAVYKNLIGTYLHGSLLPKNPWLTDWLIGKALERRYGAGDLELLDDAFELAAHQAVVRRFR